MCMWEMTLVLLLILINDSLVFMLLFSKLKVNKLNNFDGFDGKGYFVLGKSFLKNFLAFCATYFVILLQFKLSE